MSMVENLNFTSMNLTTQNMYWIFRQITRLYLVLCKIWMIEQGNNILFNEFQIYFITDQGWYLNNWYEWLILFQEPILFF